MSFYYKEPTNLNEEILCPRKTNTLSSMRKTGGVPLYSHAHSFPKYFVQSTIQDVVTTPMGLRNLELYHFMESMFDSKNLEEKRPASYDGCTITMQVFRVGYKYESPQVYFFITNDLQHELSDLIC